MKILFVAFCAPRPHDRLFGNFVHHMAKAFLDRGTQVDVLVPVRVFPNMELFRSIKASGRSRMVPQAFRTWVNGWRDAHGTVVMDGVRYFYRRFSSLPATSRNGGNAGVFWARHQEWLRELVKREGYTHVVGHFFDSLRIVREIADSYGCVPAVFIHEDVSVYLSSIPYHRISNSLDDETILFANSGKTVRQIGQYLNHPNVHLARLGIEQLPVVERKQADNGCFNIVCVSRFRPTKNQHLLVSLVKQWNGKSGRPPLRVNLVGDESDYRVHLEEMVRQEGLEREITFSNGTDHDAVARHLAVADLFVFPSRYESFGLVLIEAASVGVPIIASSDIGAVQELKQSGWRIPEFDHHSVEDLEAAVAEVVLNYQEYEQQAASLKQFVRDSFSWRKTADTILDVFSCCNAAASGSVADHPSVASGTIHLQQVRGETIGSYP